MLSLNEQQRLRNASYEDIIKYIDENNHIDSPERRGAMQILDDRRTADLTKVTIESAESSIKLGNKVFWLNVILTVATVVGSIATAILAWKALFS